MADSNLPTPTPQPTELIAASTAAQLLGLTRPAIDGVELPEDAFYIDGHGRRHKLYLPSSIAAVLEYAREPLPKSPAGRFRLKRCRRCREVFDPPSGNSKWCGPECRDAVTEERRVAREAAK